MAKKEQSGREYILMEEQETMLHAQSQGMSLLRAYVFLQPWDALLEVRNHPCSILEVEMNFFSSVQSS